MRAAELAWDAAGALLPEAAVRDGLASVRWDGRFEVLRLRPLLVLDALHTPLAARRFRETVAALPLPQPRVLVVGLLAGRDLPQLAAPLLEGGETVIVAPPSSERAADPAEVAAAFAEAGAVVQQQPNIAAAIELARVAGERAWRRLRRRQPLHRLRGARAAARREWGSRARAALTRHGRCAARTDRLR